VCHQAAGTTGHLSPLPARTPGCAAGKVSSDDKTPLVSLRSQSRNRTPNQLEKLMSYLFVIFVFFIFIYFVFVFIFIFVCIFVFLFFIV
jgi:hypothetical protein